MKLKEVIPFVDLTNTFVYVPNKLIEQMPKLNKLVNNSGEYYSKAYNPHTKKTRPCNDEFIRKSANSFRQ